MGAYSLSRRAEADIAEIYEYTIATFGLKQAQEYVSGLHERFQGLAGSPRQGTRIGFLSPELRRSRYGSHVVIYAPRDGGILAVRVLHHHMDLRGRLLGRPG